MRNKEDNRAISNEFLDDLLNKNHILNYILEKYVKDSKKDLILCFRGNGENESIILYRNNRIFWKIIKQQNGYRLDLSFDHAKYSENFWDVLEALQKLNIGKNIDKNKVKSKTNGIERKFGLIGGQIDKFTPEKIDELYKLTDSILNDYFDQDKKKNYFMISGVGEPKKEYLEKIIQQKIFQGLPKPDDEQGYMIYDLEFRAPGKNSLNKNKPDFFAVRYESNRIKGLVVGEIKSTRNAMSTGNSGLIDHLDKMKKDIKNYNIDGVRRKEAINILQEYSILGYRGLANDIFEVNCKINFDEILIVLTDDAIKAYTDNKVEKEGCTYKETINQFKKKNKSIKVVVKKFVNGKLEDI